MLEEFSNNTVSVVMPVYNAAKYLETSLLSIINQTFKDWELVLVDDCSTDSSPKIISKFQSQHPNIIYHRLDQNQGAAVARNTALNIAKGRFVAFLDSDDIWEPQKLECQMAFMLETDAFASCTASDTIDDNGNPLGKIRNVNDTIDYKFLLHNTMISTSTVIVDREKAGRFKMPLMRSGQDYATWLMLMRPGNIFRGINQVLTHYRVSKKSLSSNKLDSLRQIYQIQTQFESIGRLSALINTCCFAFNALKKRV
ncbi:MAG: glycosyltransferase family 2 protein [Bacteroidales bacterium]|nr:glycosyltransferase family 2 protein [Bacteroidales bacterium]